MTSMLLAWVAAYGQQSIEVSYDYEFPNYKTAAAGGSHNQYILRANTEESKFFSPRTEYVDSMQSTPEGMAKLNEMTKNAFVSGKLDEIPRPDGTFYIVKLAKTGKVLNYETVGMERLYSEEPDGEIEWETCDSVKEVVGYECQEATGEFHGRKWRAWFTTEIALQNGPWKLSGLPGLILEARSDDGLYSFTATGIQTTRQSIGPVYLAERYEKTSRKDMLKAKRAFLDNPLGNINAQLAGKDMNIKAIDENGAMIETKRIFATREEVDLIETDY